MSSYNSIPDRDIQVHPYEIAGIVLTHIPTGIRVKCNITKSRAKNSYRARCVLVKAVNKYRSVS